jgi:hypothetical protein
LLKFIKALLQIKGFWDLQHSIANRQERESEEATNFKARSIALASALKIELADGSRRESTSPNRKEQVLLTRCRIGHGRLTHSYLLNNEERPECILCNSNFSLKHVLIDCVDVADVRQTFYNVNNFYDLFTNVAT